jgi:hypothetical protein
VLLAADHEGLKRALADQPVELRLAHAKDLLRFSFAVRAAAKTEAPLKCGKVGIIENGEGSQT